MSVLVEPSGHVLLADPDPAMRRALTTELQREGLGVEEHREGDVAARLAVAVPDAAVVGLPEFGGLELVDGIRRTSTVPLIVLLGTSRTVDAVDALDRGADDCLQKPFRVRELAAKVRATLRRASGRRDALRAGGIVAMTRRIRMPVDPPPDRAPATGGDGR